MTNENSHYYRDDWQDSSRHLTDAGYEKANALIQDIMSAGYEVAAKAARRELVGFAYVLLERLVANEMECADREADRLGHEFTAVQRQNLIQQLNDDGLDIMQRVADSIHQDNNVEQWSVYFQRIQSKLKQSRKDWFERDGQAPSIIDAQASTIAAPPENQPLNEHSLKEKIDWALNSITQCERVVIEMRFGLGEDRKEYTLKQAAEKLDMTPENVRKIESKALRKLQVSRRSDTLRPFLASQREEESKLLPPGVQDFDPAEDTRRASAGNAILMQILQDGALDGAASAVAQEESRRAEIPASEATR